MSKPVSALRGTPCFWLLAPLFVAFAFIPAVADDNATLISEATTALDRWIEIQRTISLEKRDLAIAREMLSERIRLVQREIDSLREKIDDVQGSIAEADRKRESMVAEHEALQTASSSWIAILSSLESGTRRLLAQMPEPIRERVKPLSQRLPADTGTKISVAERFQNVVGILNEIDKFNRTVSVTSEIRTMADGTAVEVAAMYVGIGQSYYASADGAYAGIGLPDGKVWGWQEDNQASARVAKAIAILKNEDVADFVALPVTIK